MAIHDHVSDFIRDNYELREYRHASAILVQDYPGEFQELLTMLDNFRLYRSWIADDGGAKSDLAGWVDWQLGLTGWKETQFHTQIKVDEAVRDSPTHKVDCFKNRIAMEVEWNNKDPFYDRDLNNFRLLFDLGVISVGVIFTRTSELQTEVFNPMGKGKSYGNSTTHMSKLIPRLEGGGGGGCPVLAIGIRPSLLSDDPAPALPGAEKKKKRTRKSLAPLVSPPPSSPA